MKKIKGGATMAYVAVWLAVLYATHALIALLRGLATPPKPLPAPSRSESTNKVLTDQVTVITSSCKQFHALWNGETQPKQKHERQKQMATATKAARKQIIAKASDGGDVHVGQTLYNRAGEAVTITAIKGSMATVDFGDGDTQPVSLDEIRTSEKAGLVGTTDPKVADAMRSVQDDGDGEDGGDEL